jgi:phospholipid transport system substrate-binding protein
VKQPEKPTILNRRKLITGVAVSAGIGLSVLAPVPGFAAPTPAKAAKDPIVRFMNRSAEKLLKAARDGSPRGFLRFIMRYTDVSGIAMYSLGAYQADLQKKYRKTYFRGMARYITRYFTYQSRQYRVIRAEVGEKSWQEGDAYYIDTKLTLVSGATYNVRWQIVRRKKRYKISNVRVLGFWLAQFQRSQFESFISRQGGKVNALVAVLQSRK